MEIKKPLEKSSVQSLQDNVNLLILLQAKNLKEIAEGKTPEIPVDPKVWGDVVKIVEIMPKFKLFESICDGAIPSEYKVDPTSSEETPRTEPVLVVVEGNIFEERSKKIKAKLNGETPISTKSN